MVSLDAAEIRRRLSDPREVARALGCERGARRGGGGLMIRCPIHGERTDPSLSLRVGSGTRSPLVARCHGCGWTGDALSLVAAVEGLDVRRDFRRVLERAAELAGGFGAATVKESLQVEQGPARLPREVAAALFERICERGRLGARGAVEAYLARRGLLEAAREDGWASLPSLSILLECAREVWQACGAASVAGRLGPMQGLSARVSAAGAAAGTSGLKPGSADGEASRQVSGAFAFGGPEELLVAARLARWHDGELRPLWGRHRLVIPWRGLDGAITALQRRLVDAPRKMQDGREEPRYVLPWAPEAPYGAERLGENGTDCINIENGIGDAQRGQGLAGHRRPRGVGGRDGKGAARDLARQPFAAATDAPIAFVEGAVDALALRSLRPGAVVLGLPGTGAWVTAWAALADGHEVVYALDGDEAGDACAAKMALDVQERRGMAVHEVRAARRWLGDRLAALAVIRSDEQHGRCTAEETRARRGALGPARCVICGAAAELLCRWCGRVRPRGKDWGADWERRGRR